MNRLLIAGALALSAAVGPAVAADMPTKAPRVPVVTVYDWTGWYVGGHVGYGWGRKHATSVPFTFGGIPITPAPAEVEIDGWLAGGQIGYNFYQSASPGWLGGRWVFGIEAQASWSDIDGSATCTSTAVLPFVGGAITLTDTCSAKVESLGTVALRFGSAYDRLFIYSKVGVAWSRDKYNSVQTVPLLPFSSFDASENRWGWMTGVGLEYAFTNNWSGKVEYNYMNLGTERVTFVSTPAGLNIDADIKQRIHVVKFGVNYHFVASAIAARY